MISDYVSIDLEMTGLSPSKDKIIEIGAVKYKNGNVVETFNKLINPIIMIPEIISQITGITDDMVADCSTIDDVIDEVIDFIGDYVLIGHSLMYDYSFIRQAIENKYRNYSRVYYGIDTLYIARMCIDDDCSKKLVDLCEKFGIVDNCHHRALNDAVITAQLYKKLCEIYEKEEFEPRELIYKSKKISKVSKKQVEFIEKLLQYHNLSIDMDLNSLSQSEANRLADKIILKHGKMAKTKN